MSVSKIRTYVYILLENLEHINVKLNMHFSSAVNHAPMYILRIYVI